MPGMTTAIMRHGKLAYMRCYGFADVGAADPQVANETHEEETRGGESAAVGKGRAPKSLRPDTIMRIFSMSKPLVSAAAMILYEMGAHADPRPSSPLPVLQRLLAAAYALDARA